MNDILSFISLAAVGIESIIAIMFFPALLELKNQKDAGPRMLLYDNLEIGQPFLMKPARSIDVGYLLEVKTCWNGLLVKQFVLQNIESEA